MVHFFGLSCVLLKDAMTLVIGCALFQSRNFVVSEPIVVFVFQTTAIVIGCFVAMLVTQILYIKLRVEVILYLCRQIQRLICSFVSDQAINRSDVL